ncbi:formimidoylglutamase [Gaoshiqia sediminis]|uniref:Formimidoylglutamase n=1 Tax=Gaoshiqia sediminis TaxID=2986998 RepID=A0AA41Y778_9BACT|nr:formimidoylglutamase [Gaoshiqia sediminis]MCW0483135.1 formimidoylglutamase [Gaoshiqia sediminis]
MDLELYLKPVDFSKIKLAPWAQKKFALGSLLEKNQEKLPLNKAKIVLIGVEEDRNSVVKGSAKSPDKIREHLYSLNRIAPRYKILDLGNIKVGKSVNDTYFALKDVCSYLVGQGIAVVVLGGSQDLTIGMTKAFEEKAFNLVNVDPKFDYRKGAKNIDSENYLSLIFERHPNLFSQATLGYQNYFTDALELDYATSLSAETRRLGQIRYNMAEIEPYMRHADILSFDLNAVRQVEAPGQYFASPNGLYAEEACQIAHYAGMADQLKVAGFFNLVPGLDPSGLSNKLMAQIVWHFMEGFHYKVVEDPNENQGEFDEFIIEMDDIDLPLTFLQSRKTGRWWMRITDENSSLELAVPCTQEDYELAARYEIPDRWWQNIRKLNRLVK